MKKKNSEKWKKIEQTEINEEDTIRSVRIYENDPVLEFILHKDYYVVMWFSNVNQSKFLTILKEWNYPLDSPARINLKEKLYFMEFQAEDSLIQWNNSEKEYQRITFVSKKKNIDMLVDLLDNTYTSKNIGDKIRQDLEKVLKDYEK